MEHPVTLLAIKIKAFQSAFEVKDEAANGTCRKTYSGFSVINVRVFAAKWRIIITSWESRHTPIFKKLYHPSITILSAESLCITFDIQPLCINFDTHLIEYVNYLLPVISDKLRLLSNQMGYILVIA